MVVTSRKLRSHAIPCMFSGFPDLTVHNGDKDIIGDVQIAAQKHMSTSGHVDDELNQY